MTWLDDERGKVLSLNGTNLPDRKNLAITAPGATASDSEANKRTTIDFTGLTVPQYDAMADLRAVDPVDGRIAQTRGYTSPLDGGEGTWQGTTGNAPGTYTHNGGTVIVPAGGNGSAAWVRSDVAGSARAAWWGAGTSAAASVNAAALQAASDTGLLVVVDSDHVLDINSAISLSAGIVSQGGTVRQTAAATVFTCSSLDGVVVQGLSVVQASGSTDTANHGVLLDTCTNSMVQDCHFSGFAGDGVRLTDCDVATLKSLVFESAYSPAPGADASDVLHDIYLVESNSDISISGVISTSGTGISIASQCSLGTSRQRRISVVNCKATGCRNYAFMAYAFTKSGTDDAVIEIEFVNCEGENVLGDLTSTVSAVTDYHFGDGLYALGDVRISVYGGSFVNCCQNTVNDSVLTAGLMSINSVRSAIVSGVRLEQNDTFHGVDAVVDDFTESYIFSDITIKNVNGTGVRIKSGAANEADVSFERVHATELAGRGAHLTTTASGVDLRSLTFDGCTFIGDGSINDGLNLKRADFIRVRDCQVDGFSNAGVAIDNSVFAEVTDNRISNTSRGLYTFATCAELCHARNRMDTVTTDTLIDSSTVQRMVGQLDIVEKTASYTLTRQDASPVQTQSKPVVRVTSGSATTVTFPPTSTERWPTGSHVEIIRGGAGEVTLAPGAGVTLQSPGGNLRINAQWDKVEADYMGSDVWVVGRSSELKA